MRISEHSANRVYRVGKIVKNKRIILMLGVCNIPIFKEVKRCKI